MQRQLAGYDTVSVRAGRLAASAQARLAETVSEVTDVYCWRGGGLALHQEITALDAELRQFATSG